MPPHSKEAQTLQEWDDDRYQTSILFQCSRVASVFRNTGSHQLHRSWQPRIHY